MRPSDDLLSTPELDFEAWRDALRPEWGRYTPEAIEPETFAGRVRARRICGFVAIDLSCNAYALDAGSCSAGIADCSIPSTTNTNKTSIKCDHLPP
jgi:hypothetical protein